MVSLRRSSRVAPTDGDSREQKPSDVDQKQDRYQDAVAVRAQDAEKLLVVLRSVAPTLLDAPLPPYDSLSEALKNKVSLQKLWDFTFDLDTAQSGAAVRQDASKHTSTLLLQHFLKELVGQYDLKPEHKGESTNTYALHMRLPMGEYFTNAICLPEDKAQQLATGHAELVAIAPPVGRDMPLSLGDRIPRGVRLKNRPKADLRPSSFLSYGAYCSSFAPSYDSTGCVLSPSTTEQVYTIQKQLQTLLQRRWGKNLTRRAENFVQHAPFSTTIHPQQDAELDSRRDVDMSTEAPALEAEDISELDPAFASSSRSSAKDFAQQAVNLEPSLDLGLLEEAANQLEVDATLEHNAELLQELQEIQWLRTRMDATEVTSHPSVDALEAECAQDLLESLAQLAIQLPPRSLGKITNGHVWAQSIAMLTNSLQRSSWPGFWGTLPESSFGVQTHAVINMAPISRNTPAAQQAQQPTWAALVRPRVLADASTAQWIEENPPGYLAAASKRHHAGPGDAVQRAFAAPAYARPGLPGSTFSIGAYASAQNPYSRVSN
ncbi:hypothetical protein MYAM1_002634 [Malassezia yamatoensis]|uniref:Uncharacterized protein n=1 Tax=Malassezia yamatoensis TaxID=253288 RepID=A0AAJ5YSI0_9BASI|nr:hypothetical protein MYAM1_002634 [Malassezia yamatoensis]